MFESKTSISAYALKIKKVKSHSIPHPEIRYLKTGFLWPSFLADPIWRLISEHIMLFHRVYLHRILIVCTSSVRSLVNEISKWSIHFECKRKQREGEMIKQMSKYFVGIFELFEEEEKKRETKRTNEKKMRIVSNSRNWIKQKRHGKYWFYLKLWECEVYSTCAVCMS